MEHKSISTFNREETLSNSPFAYCKEWLRSLDWKLLLLLSFPLLLTALNDSWIFSYILRGYIDPFIYFGHFLDLKEHLNTFAGRYYGTRLPWILPGWLVYQLFAPLTAAYVLHLTFYYTAFISLYLILKRTLDYSTAILTTTLMGCHYFFLESVGCDYIDGAGLTYMLLTMLMLTHIAKSNYFKFRFVCAGVFYGCTIYTQLFLVVYTPLIVLFYFFINREFHLLPLKPALKSLFLGFIGLTLFLCAINYCLNGTFFFFFPILRWTAGFILKGVNPYWSPISSWWKVAVWLAFPLIVACGCFLVLVFHRITQAIQNRHVILFFQGYFILNLLMYLVLELVVKQPVLKTHYYVSYLFPAAFLAFGAQLTIIMSKLSKQWFNIFLVSIIVVFSLVHGFPLQNPWIEKFHFLILILIVFVGIVSLVTLIFFKIRYFNEVSTFLLAGSLLVINVLVSQLWKVNVYSRDFQKDSFVSLTKGVKTVQDLDPKGNGRFWYDVHLPFGNVWKSLSSVYLWQYRLFNEDFPKLKSSYCSYNLTSNDRLFILSTDKDVIAKANQNLTEIGLRAEFIDERIIHQGMVNYQITYIKLNKLNE